MGFDFKTQTERESPYIKAFNYCMKHLIFRFISPIEYWKFYKTKGELIPLLFFQRIALSYEPPKVSRSMISKWISLSELLKALSTKEEKLE